MTSRVARGASMRTGREDVHPHQPGQENANQYPSIDRYYNKKPTDRNLPDRILSIIPEAKLYKELQEAEKRLDAIISRKKLDLQDTFSRSIKKTELLRVFISNTATEQPWQVAPSLDATSFDFNTDTEPSWNLRIEGRLVDDVPADDTTRRRFSTFFTSIIVEFESEDGDVLPDGDLVEWHEPPPNLGQNVEFDVLDIRRKGDRNLRAKITMQLKEFPDKFKLSSPLSKLLALEEDTKPNVIVALWQYIKFHKLQDIDEKRLIRCDSGLKSLFGTDTVYFPQVINLITPHLLPREPIKLEYVIRVDRESTMGEVAYDIEVEVGDPIRNKMAEILENWYSNQTAIMEIDEQIALTVESLSTSRLKREFFRQMAENPSEFINNWVASQARDLKIIASDKRFNEEEVRKSSFYSDELLDQTIHYFLNTR